MQTSSIVELEAKHRALEDEITEALAHPSRDEIKIAELKRRKLWIKDQLERLHHPASPGVH